MQPNNNCHCQIRHSPRYEDDEKKVQELYIKKFSAEHNKMLKSVLPCRCNNNNNDFKWYCMMRWWWVMALVLVEYTWKFKGIPTLYLTCTNIPSFLLTTYDYFCTLLFNLPLQKYLNACSFVSNDKFKSAWRFFTCLKMSHL